MAMTWRVVPQLVSSCFYGQLRAFGEPRYRNGENALAAFRAAFAERDDFDDESTAKMRADLAAVDPAEFARDWAFLIERCDEDGVLVVLDALHRVIGPKIEERLATRTERRAAARRMRKGKLS